VSTDGCHEKTGIKLHQVILFYYHFVFMMLKGTLNDIGLNNRVTLFLDMQKLVIIFKNYIHHPQISIT